METVRESAGSIEFFAHSGEKPDGSDWQKLDEHLRAVAELAFQKMRATKADEAICQSAALAGLLHDLGKYRPEFQQMIRGGVLHHHHRYC